MRRLLIFWLLCPLIFWAQSEFKEADSLFKLGNYSKAISLYKKQIEHPNSYYKIAKSYQALGNYKQALDFYNQAVTANPDYLLIKYDQAKLQRSLKQFDLAKAGFQSLIDRDKYNPNFYFEMGQLAEQMQDSLFIKYYNTAYNLDPNHQKAIYKIARYKLVKRKHLESNEYVEKGLALYPENLQLISLKAQNFYWMQDYDQAIIWFEKLIEMGERSELIFEKLSISYAENYDFGQAIDNRKKVLAYNPENFDALYAIGLYYEKLHKFKEAEEYVTMAISVRDVKVSDEYQKLGVILNRQKKYQAAIEAFKKSLKEDPTNISSDFYMAMAKDQYYKDIDARIQVFEDLRAKYKDTPYSKIAGMRIKELKEEKFNESD